MKNMKRLFALLLVTVMIFSLVSCGNGGKTPDTTTDTSKTSEAVTTTEAKAGTESAPIESEDESESQSDSVPATESDSGSETTEAPAEELSFMSFNLRYDTTSHPLMSEQVRGEHLMQIIEKYMPSSIGFQEATDTWMDYLRTNMVKYKYLYEGVGRDDGKDTKGKKGSGNEFSAIFYRADIYEKVEGGTFWLSPTPDTVSGKAWGAGNTRICTYVVLKNKKTGTMYAHFNTHLDHVSAQARENGALLIISRINMVLEKYGNIGIVATGDFNDVYDSKTYNIMTSHLLDSRYEAVEKLVEGSTWSGFQNPVEWESGHASDRDKPNVNTDEYPIDHIFVSRFFRVPFYTVVDDTFDTEYEGKTWYYQPVSDHYGVYCKVTPRQGGEIFVNESNLIDIPAFVYEEDEVPQGALEGLTNFAPDSTAKSSISTQSGFEIGNILLEGNDKFTKLINNSTAKGFFWEVTITLNAPASINAVSFTTTNNENALPRSVRLFVSPDGINWYMVGGTVTEIEKGKTYTYILNTGVVPSHLKLVMVDAPVQAELSNISLYGTRAIETIVPNSKIELISGPKPGHKEGYENLFDNSLETKYYHNLASDGELVPIIFKVQYPVRLTAYTLYTANDHETYTGRLAKAWVLYGSATGEEGSWQAISTITDSGLEEKNFKPYTFIIENPTEYQYYKLEFTQAGTNNRLQFAEIILHTGEMS